MISTPPEWQAVIHGLVSQVPEREEHQNSMRGARLLLVLFLASWALEGVPARADWNVPVASKKLANGLTVVVSEDHSAPTFGLCLAYVAPDLPTCSNT
jgi:hypothetical protein